MPRPHTEFIQAQRLPWEPRGRPGTGVERRLLSSDPVSGASTELLRFPAGIDIAETPQDRAEELFVLQGELSIAGMQLGEHDYGYIPAGVPRGPLSSVSGAVVLTFFSEVDSISAGQDSVTRLQSARMTWAPGISDPNLSFMGLGRKVLRDDAARQERTLLISMAPQAFPVGSSAPQISHPCVEECYLIAGDIITEYGVMGPGAYFWRPANVPHGPHGSRYGAFMVIRFVEGLHENHWGDVPAEFRLDPPYRPVLPASLQPYAEPRPLQPF